MIETKAQSPSGVPAIWDEILETLHKAKIPAVLAGGTVRDHILNRPVKDIDVFVPSCAAGELVLTWTGWEPEGIKALRNSDLSYAPWSDGSVQWTVTLDWKGHKVQIIGVYLKEFTARNIVERMDFGLCQAWYDREEGFLNTEHFTMDAEDEKLTLLRADNEKQREYSLKRYARLTAEKYAGWPLVDESHVQR